MLDGNDCKDDIIISVCLDLILELLSQSQQKKKLNDTGVLVNYAAKPL